MADLDQNQHRLDENQPSSGPVEKLPYQAPVLIYYGTIEDLVATHGNAGGDGVIGFASIP